MAQADIEYLINPAVVEARYPLFSRAEAKKALGFHAGIPGYKATRLVRLSRLAGVWGLRDIYVKDESRRFGLNAFKVLGGSYAVANLLCEKLGKDIAEVDFDYLISDAAKDKLGDITFATATDGNHGRGIAWAAEKLRQKAVVYMPRGAALARVKSIESHGATVIVTDSNYDDTVKQALAVADSNGWCMVQDTAWDGYTKIPTWIMQGYLTMIFEAKSQLENVKPTHVFLQAGVGAMAGAALAAFVDFYGPDAPKAIIIEPTNAACIFESARAGDGQPHSVSGSLETIMAGLSCGEPNSIGWEILNQSAFCFMTAEDYLSANGMRILSCPVLGDPRVISGESGPIGIGVLDLIANNNEYAELKKALALDENSVVLLINTEGNTDPVNFREIVWYGKYLKPGN